jgi:pyruvate formate lyase activating enzyme
MIKIAGLQKVTLIDYPGQVAATVFLAGCNFRCSYCHNPELVEVKTGGHYIPVEEFFEYLKKRKNVLDGVCVSGGEPLLNKEDELIDFLRQIKVMGF